MTVTRRCRLKAAPGLAAVLVGVAVLAGCADEGEPTVPGRWYTKSQVELGERVFADTCAACHGASAEGRADDWRKPLADGSYPPPPLNGTAHAWHHPLSVLRSTIAQGGARFGGKMPGFEGRLTEAEQDAAIAFFQIFWSDEIYAAWLERGGIER